MTNSDIESYTSNYIKIYPVDLSCNGYKGEQLDFRVEILTYALDALIEASLDARCVYELFSIRRLGDVFKYLWLKPIALPSRLQSRYESLRSGNQDEYSKSHPFLDDQVPYLKFDDMFYPNWDADPEENVWLQMRHSDNLKAFIECCYEQVKQAQQNLRSSYDVLIQNTIRLMDEGNHPFDYRPNTPFTMMRHDWKPHKLSHFSENYYLKLVELLSNPSINSVACRDSNDYQTIKLCCAEQLRRVMHDGVSLDDFELCALGDSPIDVDAWGAQLTWYSEGLGYGDLFIQQEMSYGTPIKALVEAGRISTPFIYCCKVEGDIDGYQREIGDGWVLYTQI
jgi:hypothetical protein